MGEQRVEDICPRALSARAGVLDLLQRKSMTFYESQGFSTTPPIFTELVQISHLAGTNLGKNFKVLAQGIQEKALKSSSPHRCGALPRTI